MLVRPFLPESPEWQHKKARGTLKRPSLGEIFRPEYRRTTIVTAVMFACSYGAAFGAIQHIPRIVPGMPGVSELPRPAQQQIVSAVQFFQEIGGLAGRFILALLAVRIVSRRRLIRIFQIPGLIVFPIVFTIFAVEDVELLKWGIALAGLLTIGQFSFWGNYLPRVYPTHLRGTGESFAANIGGRMIGTFFAVVTAQLATAMPGATVAVKTAYAAAIVGFSVYAVGFIASFWLPEPDERKLAD
jgi:hypothetical protein